MESFKWQLWHTRLHTHSVIVFVMHSQVMCESILKCWAVFCFGGYRYWSNNSTHSKSSSQCWLDESGVLWLACRWHVGWLDFSWTSWENVRRSHLCGRVHRVLKGGAGLAGGSATRPGMMSDVKHLDWARTKISSRGNIKREASCWEVPLCDFQGLGSYQIINMVLSVAGEDYAHSRLSHKHMHMTLSSHAAEWWNRSDVRVRRSTCMYVAVFRFVFRPQLWQFYTTVDLHD